MCCGERADDPETSLALRCIIPDGYRMGLGESMLSAEGSHMQVDASYPAPVLGGTHATFAELLSAAAEAFPQQEAYVHRGERIGYGAWYDQSLRLAAALRECGVTVGDVVLVSLEPSIDFAVCFAAAQLTGAIASGVNPRLGRREVAGIIAQTAAPVMIVEDGADEPDGVPHIIRRGELASLLKGKVKAVPHLGKASDLAVIIWTSGTTGQPKGACFAHENLRTAIHTAGPLAAPFARKLSSVPFAHAGYMAKGWEQVAYGMTLVITETPWSAGQMLHLLVDETITIAGAVPTQWSKLLELPELAHADLSHIAVGVTATAPAPPELIERVTQAIGAPLIVRYSMTECPSMTGTRIGDSAEVQYRTVGRPQPGVEIALRDVDQTGVGRIAVRSAGAMQGYWRDPERTAEALSGDGWLLSSDLGRFDPDGNLVLAGRTTEMYIRGGYNVYPIEVERVLSELLSVAAVAVIGVATPIIGEVGVVFVVPADPAAPPTLEELRSHVRSELADYKAPDRLVLLEALPLTAMMKIDKAVLRGLA
jgi:acyl-CoA synthetase (AMP-forming)/AMP-acid ligase II